MVSSTAVRRTRRSEMQEECFRLVCCGLVSEERVKDGRVLVTAAAGVVIYDFRGNVVKEIQKPLIGMTPEMAVLQGLVHGLNTALTLELTTLTLLCDDHTVYDYIATSRSLGIAGHGKTARLVNEVASLQAKFKYCEPALGTPDEMKRAVKLARDAISSQAVWPAENGKVKQQLLKETCVICFQDVDRMFTVDGCLHRFCFSCMKQHVEVELKRSYGTLPNCPHERCYSPLAVDQSTAFLDPRQVQMLSERTKEASIPVADKVYCPYPKCSALMSKHEALTYTRSAYVGAYNSAAGLCQTCHRYFCINCKVPWHYNLSCRVSKRRNHGPPTEDKLFKSLAKKKLWRTCVKCKHMIERAEGCRHITCRCGHEFCYKCGEEWGNNKATCHCYPGNDIHRSASRNLKLLKCFGG